jgi:hypothetical protein
MRLLCVRVRACARATYASVTKNIDFGENKMIETKLETETPEIRKRFMLFFF